MNRRLFHGQLADEIAGDDRLRAERLRLLARSLVDIVRDALVRDGVVRIHGFGTFRLSPVRARRGINPRTGERIEIPARNRVLFRPAKALRERIEPGHPGAVALAEPHESREACLGGAMGDTPVAGGLPASEQAPVSRTYFPDRVAAAAMPEPTARVTGSAHPAPRSARDDGSREASLGGVMADSPSAGRVMLREDAADSPPNGLLSERRAANEDTGGSSRETAPGGVGVSTSSAAGSLPEEGAPDVDTGRGREAPAAAPVAEPQREAPGRSTDTQPPADEQPPSVHHDRRRLLLAVSLLLLLLLLALAWWWWPDGEPAPPVTATETPVVTGTEDTAPDAAADTATAAGSQAAETGDDSGEAATAGAATDAQQGETDIVTADEPAATVAAEEPEASTGGEPEGAEPATTEGTGAPTGEARARPDERGGSVQEAGTAGESAAGDSAAAGPADTPWFSGRAHRVTAGDTLWGLSDRHYVNPYYWPHIWNHNRSLADPDRIEIDQRLWLPTLEGEPRTLTAADRRSIAEGYLRLYRLWQRTGVANPEYALVGVRYFDPAVMPPGLRDDPAAGRPADTLAAAFEAQLEAAFPARR